MRLNKFIALATGISRRAADSAISEYRVGINGNTAKVGTDVTDEDVVTLDGRTITPPVKRVTIMLNKPAGYVVSRDGQGSETIYDLLPYQYDRLKPVGRLDKDSSGILLLTNDGDLANRLTHPSYQKQKVYVVTLDAALQPLHRQMISDYGVKLQDGISKFELERVQQDNDLKWKVIMTEGRNRQIRRTFESLGYGIVTLHRTQFGNFTLKNLPSGRSSVIDL